MVFVKVLKNKAYFKNYQVKKRRRREGKTDYKSRKSLIVQDVNKYNLPKHRFVVRLTNKRILCQVVYSTIEGDRIICTADSSELPRYGVPVGLTNYAAAYCTGLLCARRLMDQLHLDYDGVEEVTGEHFLEEEDEGRRPFKAYLDVGLVRTTTGNRVFGAMKGACDGGMVIPHSTRRFPGWSAGESDAYDADAHRRRIFGLHVAGYMQQLKEEDDARYKQHFAAFLKHGINPDDIEKMYMKAHKAIRASPQAHPKPAKSVTHTRNGNFISDGKKSWPQPLRLTGEERRVRVQRKMQLALEAAANMEQ